MLGWWSDAREPAVDSAWISAAFAAPPSDAAQRHALLSGRPGAAAAPRGRIVCSCFGVGERSINEAIASGCASVGALGGKLKCGTNCGSCVPELNALLAAQRTAGVTARRYLRVGRHLAQPVSAYSWNCPQGCGSREKR
jgi:assimilatory nitrate reductase catalytic subunit